MRDPVPTESEPRDQAPRNQAPKDQVLVISDRTELVSGLREALEPRSLEVLVGGDGKAGVALATEHLPAAIVLDADLRIPSGFSVCNVIRRNPRLREIPLVMVSARMDQAALDQHGQLRTRADDYVPAPGHTDAVLAALEPRVAETDPEARRTRLRAISDKGAPVLATSGLSSLLLLLAGAIIALAIYFAWKLT